MRLVYVLAILLIVASVKSFDRLLVPSVTISSDNLMGNATVQIFSALYATQTTTVNIFSAFTTQTIQHAIDETVDLVLSRVDGNIAFRVIRVKTNVFKYSAQLSDVYWVFIDGYDSFR